MDMIQLNCLQVTKEDVKEVVANISQLKYELQTNKELVPLTSNGKCVNLFKIEK